MSQVNPQEVGDRLKYLKDEWLEKYRGLIVRESPKKEPTQPIVPLFGGSDAKLTDAPLGWGEGTRLPGGPHLDGLKTTYPERFREGEGVIDLIENDEGRRMIAKIDRTASAGQGASELAAYQHVYETAGRHPNLATVHGLAVVQHGVGKMPALIMDEVVGDPGEKTMRKLGDAWKKGAITSAEYWGAMQFMGKRMLEVIKHLQEAGLAHNDIKPQNFVVDAKTGEPVLIDLGLHNVVGTRAPGGTEGFSSPGIMGKGSSTTTSDVYSVGRTLDVGLGGRDGTLDTDVARALAAMMSGRDGKLDPTEAASLEFFSDSLIDDEAAKKVLAKIVGTSDEKPQVKKVTVSEDEAEKLCENWRSKVTQIGDRNDLFGARGRRRMEWLQNAEDLLMRAKSENVSGRIWEQLESTIQTCNREMAKAAEQHQEPPKPQKWTAEWQAPSVNQLVLTTMAGSVQNVISESTELLNDPPHLSTLQTVLALHERSQTLLVSLRAYLNALTPPILPKPKVLAQLKKKNKPLPPWESLGEMATARELFSAQLEQIEPIAERLRQRGVEVGKLMGAVKQILPRLTKVDWYSNVRDATNQFMQVNPTVFNSLDEERTEKVRQILEAAQTAWQAIGDRVPVLQKWQAEAIEVLRNIGPGLMPDREIDSQRTELRTMVGVVGRALTIERDWIKQPGGQPPPPRESDAPPPSGNELVVELKELRKKIEAASVAPERSLKVRSGDLVSLGKELDGYESTVDEETRPTLEAVRSAWKRAVERVKTQQKEALTGARKLLKETTPDHIWRTLNSIRVHMSNPYMDAPVTKWFVKELDALALIVTKVQRFLAQVGDDLEEKEEQGLFALLNSMEGYDELRRHFELEARKKPLTPPSTEKPSELSQQLEVLSNDMQQAAAAPWPEVSDFKEKMTKRLDSVKAFRQRIRALEQTVRDSKVEADIEQFELLVRVQEGLEKALNDRLS